MAPTRKQAEIVATGARRTVDGASLVGIYTAPKSGASMEQQRSVVVVPGQGIVGDRYALRTGTWSNPKWPDQELTLFASEVAESIGIEPYQARRNLVTQGMELSGLVGVRFRIGDALIAGVRACEPCRYIQQLNAHPGLTKALAGYNGGLRARVVEGGTIRLGDAIEIIGLDESGSL